MFIIIKLITDKNMNITSEKGVYLFLVCCFMQLSSNNWLLKQKERAIPNLTTRVANLGPIPVGDIK